MWRMGSRFFQPPPAETKTLVGETRTWYGVQMFSEETSQRASRIDQARGRVEGGAAVLKKKNLARGVV